MDKKQLLQSGQELADTLIAYLAKDAIGGVFLNSYLGEQNEQTKSTKEQREALDKLIKTANDMQQATTQMSGRAGKNIERLSSIYEKIAELQASATHIEEEYQKYTLQFKNLIDQTQTIKRQMNDISEISERTNLLSFNASIEAAHAGKLGAGFRIIANEVKKLSENTKKATDKIKSDMENLSNSISTLEKDTKSNAIALEKLATETEQTLTQFESVRKLNSANNSDIEQISEAIATNMSGMDSIVQTVQATEAQTKKNVALFADSASKNEMLFNDLYSFAYELKAIFADLQKD